MYPNSCCKQIDSHAHCRAWSNFCKIPERNCPQRSYCIISPAGSFAASSTPTKNKRKTKRASIDKGEDQGSIKSGSSSKRSIRSYSGKISSRSSSAGSTKSAPTAQNSLTTRHSKSTASDSKVFKQKLSTNIKKNGKEKSKLDPQSVQQLKDDLHLIKEQLLLLTKNRNDALELTNELQARYADLLKKNQDQEKLIETLKHQNEKLLKKIKKRQIGEGPHIEEVVETKKNLDQYESKLNTLYGELVSSTKILEQSRNNVCRCIQEKNDEFKNILTSTKRLSQSLEDKNGEYEKLMESYQKAKKNEDNLSREKEELTLSVGQLEEKLNRSLMELENLKNETALAEMKKKEEIQHLNKCYACQLEAQSQKITKLNSTLQHLTTNTGDNIESEYNKLKKEHDQVLQRMKVYQDTSNQRYQELQKLKMNEKKVLGQLTKLQNYSNELTEINNKQRLTINQLESMNEQQETAIQRLRADMASKEKQIEILMKSEDRLKKRIIDLQEEIVGMKICNHQCSDKNVLTIDEPALHLTDELHDLITALYEEIDKTMAKDEQIQLLNKRICHLQCTLTGKEKELVGVHNELKILREQFTSTLKEKPVLSRHLNIFMSVQFAVLAMTLYCKYLLRELTEAFFQHQQPLDKLCELEECEC